MNTVALAAMLGGLATASSAATIDFVEGVSPEPTYSYHAATVRNDGANSTVSNNSTRLLTGSVGSGALRAIFSLDLSAIPDGATVDSASFQIYQEADNNSVAGDYTVELRTISTSFAESTATWASTFGDSTVLGPTALSSTVMDPRVAAETLHTFATSASFVSAVQAAIDGGGLFNFALVVPEAEGGPDRVVMRLGADEANVTGTLVGLRPSLTVEYTAVPEPAALSLLGVGAVALLGRRRRA